MKDMRDEESFLIVYRTAGNHSTFPDHESGQNIPVITRKKNTSGDENASSKKRKKLLFPVGPPPPPESAMSNVPDPLSLNSMSAKAIYF